MDSRSRRSARILAGGSKLRSSERKVAFDGFMSDLYDEKTERDRRYGTVYTVSEHANAYLVRLEMPRKLPASSLKRLWNLPDEMPDYDYNIALLDGVLTISASVRGEALRRLCHVSASCPADFTTRIEFAQADRSVQTSTEKQAARYHRDEGRDGRSASRRLKTRSSEIDGARHRCCAPFSFDIVRYAPTASAHRRASC